MLQVAESSPDRTTSVVTLTISPPGPAIHTVYCVPYQNDVKQGQNVKIEVFPFDESNGIDWVLYNHMYNLIYGTPADSSNN